MAEQQPIIIKKVYKSGGGHGGGAWKIAYADFVTAMMAFFLLMWLLNSVTQEQLEGISNYFAPAATSAQMSGSGDILGGKTIGEPGAMEQAASQPTVTVELPPPKAGSGELDGEKDSPSDSEYEELKEQFEQEQFEEAAAELHEKIQSIPQLKQLAKSLLIENTPEGLRIQLVDQEGLAMFPSGGSDMYLHTKKVLELVKEVILEMPQDIAISGHTDAVKFVTDNGYGNWELSADRANNARRNLEEMGVPEDRVARVVGRAATEPLLKEDPENARNRRLSIVLLRGTGEQELPEEMRPEAEGDSRVITVTPDKAIEFVDPQEKENAPQPDSSGEQSLFPESSGQSQPLEISPEQQ